MKNSAFHTKLLFITTTLFVSAFFPVFWVSLWNTVATSVVDEAWVLTDTYEKSIIDSIIALEQETTAQIAVVTVDSLEWRAIFDVWLDLARYWTDDSEDVEAFIEKGVVDQWVWNNKYDNWIIVLVAPQERERNIQVGDWLEWRIPDAVAKRMGQQILVPAFRQESYGEWLIELVNAMGNEIKKESSDREETDTDEHGVTVADLFIVYFVLVLFFGPLLKAYLKTDNEKYYWAWIGSVFLTALGWLWVWWWALWLLIPVFLLLLFTLFAEQTSWTWWSGWSYWWWFSSGWRWWWSFSSWWWWSFSGWWASWSW